MPIRLLVTLAVSLLILGASYAFADGLLNDAETTRSLGGVGNFLFHDPSDNVPRRSACLDCGSDYETGASTREDSLGFRRSSAISASRMIRFDRDSSEIRKSEEDKLDRISDLLQSDPALRAHLVGGPERTRAVIRDLESRGVSPVQLSWGRPERISERGVEIRIR